MGNNNSTITEYEIKVDNITITIEFFGGRVMKVEPITYKWMVGQSMYKMKSWVDSKFGTIERIK